MVKRGFQGFQDDIGACLFVAVQCFSQFSHFFCRMDVCGTTAGNDAFLCCRSGGVQCIFHTEFCFFHLCLCCSAYADHGYAAGQFCKSLLQFLFVKIRSGIFHLSLDLGNPCLNVFFVACAVYDHRIFFLHFDRFGTAEIFQGSFFQIQTQLIGNHLATGQDGNVLQHSFSSVAIAGRLHCHYVECATQLVDDQCGKRFSFYILRNDQKFRTGLYHLFQHRENLLNIADLLICNQDIRIIQIGFHLIHICCHVSGNISSVELHTFHQIQFCFHGLALFDGNDAVTGYLFHRICYHSTHFFVSGRNCSNSCKLIFSADFGAHLFDGLHCTVSCLLHTFS